MAQYKHIAVCQDCGKQGISRYTYSPETPAETPQIQGTCPTPINGQPEYVASSCKVGNLQIELGRILLTGAHPAVCRMRSLALWMICIKMGKIY